MSEQAPARGRPRLIPLEAVTVSVKLFPEEVHHVDRCAANRVHDKVRSATLRDILKSSRLCFPILARLILVAREADRVLQASSFDAILRAPLEPESIPSTAPSTDLPRVPGGAYAAPRTPGLTFPGAALGQPFLASLGREDTAAVLQTLRAMLPALEHAFKLETVGLDHPDEGTDPELHNRVLDKKEQIAFDRALAEALGESLSDDSIKLRETP